MFPEALALRSVPPVVDSRTDMAPAHTQLLTPFANKHHPPPPPHLGETAPLLTTLMDGAGELAMPLAFLRWTALVAQTD